MGCAIVARRSCHIADNGTIDAGCFGHSSGTLNFSFVLSVVYYQTILYRSPVNRGTFTVNSTCFRYCSIIRVDTFIGNGIIRPSAVSRGVGDKDATSCNRAG